MSGTNQKPGQLQGFWRRKTRAFFQIFRRFDPRTNIDSLDRPDLSGGGVEIVKGMRKGNDELNRERLSEYLRRFGSGTVVKRLGFLAEAMGLAYPPSQEVLKEWDRFRDPCIEDANHRRRARP